MPQRRVDLYQRICDLQLKDRPEAKELETLLINTDAQVILQMLALEMLLNNREKNIDQRTLLTRLAKYLQAENETVDAKVFLDDVVRISELLIEKDVDSYEFAHWSFQEYLAAKQILDTNQVDLLTTRFDDLEWRPTILLYATQLKNPSPFLQSMIDCGAGDLADAAYRETSRSIDPAIAAELQALKSDVQDLKYAKLAELLKAQDWEAADEETYRLMITTVGKEEGQPFMPEDLKNFPCSDLRTIDQLWVSASDGHFGFSVQKRIWEECGSPMSWDEDWDRFCVRVGWKDSHNDYVLYSSLKKSPLISPKGELPVKVVGGWGYEFLSGVIFSLAQRLVNCSTRQS